jgi:predicted nucleotidyltransferase
MARIRPTDLPEKVQQVIRRIAEGYDPEKIIIFGSYARGDWNEDSDLDVLVVKNTSERWLDRIVAVSSLCRPRLLPMDILVKTPGEIEAALGERELFVRQVMEDGFVAYERETADDTTNGASGAETL